jgi:UDP-GlcNAc:undecaprenyl-phosphate GlcNAc-1-phosphate transferase
MIDIVILILSSFIVSVLAISGILKLSHKKAWYDTVDDRKIHSGDVPRLGGMGFAVPIIIAAFYLSLTSKSPNLGVHFLFPLASMILTLALGVYDDFRPITTARKKLLLQCLIAILVIIPDYTFQRIFFFDIGGFGELGWIRYPLTLIWIVGMMNAVNFIDGIDSLAGGFSLIAVLSLAFIYHFYSASGRTVLFCYCTAAALAGFLIFNNPFPKAKIFMGDGGSQFLGLLLALIPLIDKEDQYLTLPLANTAAFFIIPVFDAFAKMWRLVRERRTVYNPDQYHTHHKLLRLGLNVFRVNIVLFGLQILLGALVFFSIRFREPYATLSLGAAYLVGLAFFTVLHFISKKARS